jgi:hypothetical protein
MALLNDSLPKRNTYEHLRHRFCCLFSINVDDDVKGYALQHDSDFVSLLGQLSILLIDTCLGIPIGRVAMPDWRPL